MSFATAQGEPVGMIGTEVSFQDADTRFLLPFSFQRRMVDRAVKALESLTVPRRRLQVPSQPGELEKPARPVWVHKSLHDIHNPYIQEATDSLQELLFLDGEAHKPQTLNGAYLQLNHEVAAAWFSAREVSVALGKSGSALDRVPVRLAKKSGVELFLSGHGVGVLSIDLEPVLDTLDREQILRFNYMLSQFRRSGRPAPVFSYPPLPEGPPETLLPRKQADWKLATSDRPLIERLGLLGVSFTLDNLASHLLEPLDALGQKETQPSLVVYSTMRLSESTAFTPHSAAHARLSEFMYGAAQVHEPGHPGRGDEASDAAEAILNESHWTAMSSQGAAHLCADQGQDFDKDRLARVRFKYFAVFLAALLQRTFLDHKSKQISLLAAEKEIDEEWLGELKSSVLQFALTGNITTASTRSTVQRYYRLCQEVLGVPAGLDHVKQALSELHEAQIGKIQHRIHRAVHRIEALGVFIGALALVIAALTLWLDLRKSSPETTPQASSVSKHDQTRPAQYSP